MFHFFLCLACCPQWALEDYEKVIEIDLLVSLAVALASSATSFAQPPPPNQGIIGIAHVAFRVSDLDREIVFFGKLGYEEAFTLTYGKTTEAFIKINDHEFIELYPQTDRSQPLSWMNICYRKRAI